MTADKGLSLYLQFWQMNQRWPDLQCDQPVGDNVVDFVIRMYELMSKEVQTYQIVSKPSVALQHQLLFTKYHSN